MTRLVARLVLAMLTLPVAGAAFVIGVVVLAVTTPFGPEYYHALALWCAVYAVTGAYWVFIWRSAVVWTRRRVYGTALAAPLSVGAGLIFGAVVWLFASPQAGADEALLVATFLGGGVPPIVWVLATVVLWRETTQERIARVRGTGAETLVCPACGYSMVGQREARCPECGASYTLDALVAAQPRADAKRFEED